MRNLIILTIVVITLFSCSNNKNNDSLTTDIRQKTSDSALARFLKADPDSHWKEVEPLLEETFTAPIGKYPCAFKTILVSVKKGDEIIEERNLPCNCATYNGDNVARIILVDDSLSLFAGEYLPQLDMIQINRYAIRKSYREMREIIKETTLDTITYLRWVSASLQQEIWHSKGGTDEFLGDVVSIKIAKEWFVCLALLRLIEHQNGGSIPESYKEMYGSYTSFFQESGLDLKDLKSGSKTFGEQTKAILKKYPGILTEVKEKILKKF